MSNVVAIVGRPNVGKSTLFNRLIGQRKAIVDDVSGVTRDRHYGKADWLDKEFTVIDTGGYVPDSSDLFEKEIRNQVKIAMEEADALIFVVDVTTDITPLDEEFTAILRKSKKPVILAVNKVDSPQRYDEMYSFYALGFEILFPISSITGSGTGDLLDELVKHLDFEEEEEESELPKLSVIGRPNVGKSSFINALLNKERNIVTDIAGTTRDTIHSHYKAFGKDLILVDTAGIRKKSKVHEDIEFYSVMRSIKAIENSDVCILMLDATMGMHAQDMSLFGLAQKNNKGILILANKWDLIEEKDNSTHKQAKEVIHESIKPFTDVPIEFVSALTKQRISKALDTALQVRENMQRRISTSELNDFILPILQQNPPPATKGKYIKIKYAAQLPSKSVAFAFFCNLPQYIGESYTRFIENRLREKFNFNGVPINIYYRRK